jgi:hypothetical protein
MDREKGGGVPPRRIARHRRVSPPYLSPSRGGIRTLGNTDNVISDSFSNHTDKWLRHLTLPCDLPVAPLAHSFSQTCAFNRQVAITAYSVGVVTALTDRGIPEAQTFVSLPEGAARPLIAIQDEQERENAISHIENHAWGGGGD